MFGFPAFGRPYFGSGDEEGTLVLVPHATPVCDWATLEKLVYPHRHKKKRPAVQVEEYAPPALPEPRAFLPPVPRLPAQVPELEERIETLDLAKIEREDLAMGELLCIQLEVERHYKERGASPPEKLRVVLSPEQRKALAPLGQVGPELLLTFKKKKPRRETAAA